MQVKKLNNHINFKDELKKLGVDKVGINIMQKKMNLNLFYIKNIKTPAANILKQDALSIGAEFAVPSGVITCEKKVVDGILIGNDKQIEILSKKELAQPFGLKAIAKELSEFIKKDTKKPIKIMGIINANDDSFFSASRFNGKEAKFKIEEMISDGADIIDIGGVSSRPGSVAVSEEKELSRVKPIIDEIYSSKLYEKASFSLDSYTPNILRYALDRGFNIVNDITGLANDEVAKVASEFEATVVIMHMQNEPSSMQNNPTYEDVTIDISNFFEEKIKKAESFGVKEVILDVGIGFGKRLEHNIELIKNLEHFKRFGCELLIGASRKSMIDKITPTKIEERLAGTLALHLQSINNGATIVRVHDVKEHFQAIKVLEAIK